MEQKQQKKNRLPIAILFSLLLHAIFLFSKTATWNKIFNVADKKSKYSQDRTIKVFFTKKTPTPQNDQKTGKQIVNTEQNGRREKASDAKYLGESDQTFDRQTVAKKIDSFRGAAKGLENGSLTPDQLQNTAKGKVQKNKESQRPKEVSLSDLGFASNNVDPSQFKQNLKAENAEENGDKGNTKGGMAQGTRTGTEKTPGVAANNDYVEDVPLGDATHLNTAEFKYYGFYFRIRQRLEQYWGRSLKEKANNIYRAGRKLPGDTDLITSLIITLNDQGKIVDVQVKGTSGVKELDDAAIESFNQAGPFPNPPNGMAVNGQIKIEWGFVVKG